MSEISATVLERLARLEAKDAISALMFDYIYTADRVGEADAIAEFFTEDAIYEPQGLLGEAPPKRGRDAIRQTFAALPTRISYTAHFLTNERIEVGADCQSATGQWHTLELLTCTNPAQEVVQVAWYNNDFVYVDGRWRIKHIRFGDTLSFPFSEGWAQIRHVSLAQPVWITHDGETIPAAARGGA